MGSSKLPKMRWLKSVASHDYDAAYAYLSLLLDPARATDLVNELELAPVIEHRVNDLVRATGRNPLALDDPGVQRDLAKLRSPNPKRLSPILVVSWKAYGMVVADGWHRLSLAYHADLYADMPLKIAYET